MNKQLEHQIEKRLETLQKLIEQIGNHDIHPAEPELWDSDYYYDLVEQLKEALQMLQGKKHTDRYGEVTTLEEGLCSLIDTYHEDQEEDNND